MPLYEFRCQECDHLEEVLQKFTDPPPALCPACGKEHTMAKEVSLTSFQLKGGGWYKDLYSSVPKDGGKSEGGDKAAKAETKDKAPSAKSDGAKAEPAKKKSGEKAKGGSKAKAA